MNKSLSLVLTLLLGLSISTLTGQTLRQYENKAAEEMEQQDFNTALAYYQAALKIDTNKIENLIGAAEAARRFNAYQLSEYYLEKVALHSNRKDFPQYLLALADVKKSRAKYAEAEQLYLHFSGLPADSVQAGDIAMATAEATNCRLAQDWVEDTLSYVTVNNLKEINTPNSEFAPARLGADLYYSSLRFDTPKDAYEDEKARLWMLRSINGTAGGERITWESTELNAVQPSFSPNGRRVYYTKCQFVVAGRYNCEIWYRDRDGEGWGPAKKLPEIINQPGANTTHPNVAQDEKGQQWLFFASDRPGGKGRMDVYCSMIQGDSDFTPPAGLPINSPSDEITPFFHTASQTLYFSTDGRESIGGYDVLCPQKKGGGGGKPQHNRVPPNTSYNEVNYVLDDRGMNGYLASNRPGGVFDPAHPELETCCPDIYALEFKIQVDLLASTFNALTRAPLPGTRIRLINLTDGTEEYKEEASTHMATWPLMLEKNYMIIAERPDYSSDTVNFNTFGITANTTIKKDLFLTPPIELLVNTHHEITRRPLSGVKVELIELTASTASDKTNNKGNDFTFPVTFERRYMLVASKEGFFPDTLEFTTLDLEKVPTFIKKDLYLAPTDMTEFIPLPIFFDNDEPDKRTLRTFTLRSYDDTYREYVARKQEFVFQYTKHGSDEKSKNDLATAMEAFFDNRVQRGFDTLQSFASALTKFLAAGYEVEMKIQGFASPRAKEDYNKNLTSRRISSVQNYLAKFENGALRDYINKGQLKITEEPLGESTSPITVNDDLNNPVLSVFSPDASEERRVEIVEIKTQLLKGATSSRYRKENAAGNTSSKKK